MADLTAEVVICGAGIAAAYHLAVTHGMTDVVLVERGAPLSLTSDKSTECYRNWWPGPDDAMVGLMNRTIDLLEEIARNPNLGEIEREADGVFDLAHPLVGQHGDPLLDERLRNGCQVVQVYDAGGGQPVALVKPDLYGNVSDSPSHRSHRDGGADLVGGVTAQQEDRPSASRRRQVRPPHLAALHLPLFLGKNA